MLGSDQREVLQAIARAVQEPSLPLSVRASLSGTAAAIHVEASNATGAELYVAIAADHAQSTVLRGENGGHTLTHVAIVKSIVKIGKWEETRGPGRDFSLSVAPGKAGATRIIAILEDPKSGRVLGSAQTRI